MSWELSTTLDSSFCVSALEEALATHGRPEIFNTDQGAQYTDREFMKVLKNHDIRISMDGRGRAWTTGRLARSTIVKEWKYTSVPKEPLDRAPYFRHLVVQRVGSTAIFSQKKG